LSSGSSSAPPGRGKLFIIAAPSGGGKTSLVNALMAADPRLALSISHTTRRPRSRETDGVQYHFIDADRFRRLRDEGAFLEHAKVFGNYYGTHAGALEVQLESGFDVILEIDWQGAAQVRKVFPDCCSIFILPPSLDVLRQRLSRRAQDSEEIIDGRMRDAQSEISHWDEFDYLVVNEDFERAVQDLQAIIDCARTGRFWPQKQHAQLLAELLGSR
jgi:guanylate kinase